MYGFCLRVFFHEVKAAPAEQDLPSLDELRAEISHYARVNENQDTSGGCLAKLRGLVLLVWNLGSGVSCSLSFPG